MKTSLTLLLIGLMACSSWAQTWKENRSVAGITALKASAGVDVYLKQGSSESLTLDVKGFDKDEVIAEVRNGQLTIGRHQNNLFGGSNWGISKYIKAYVTVKQLSTIEASSGADVQGETDFQADKLAINVSSGADLNLQLNVRTLDVQVSSGADVDLAGKAGKLSAQVSGGADLNADKLIADVCYAQASGGADARVYGKSELYLQASGGADVTYRGPGRLMTKKESGGGDVNQD